MATIQYADDDDLIKIRPNILDLGVSDWTDQHLEAFDLLNRLFEGRWYKEVALEHDVDYSLAPFDPDKVSDTQVRRLASYKALELIYLFLMKDGPEADGFEREHKLFKDRSKDELGNLMSIGLDYDWDADDTIQEEERQQPRFRRLAKV